ncbi:hypothetical protein Chor_016427 [Crotalus horridus]
MAQRGSTQAALGQTMEAERLQEAEAASERHQQLIAGKKQTRKEYKGRMWGISGMKQALLDLLGCLIRLEERECIKVPRDMDDAKALGKVLSKYKDTFYVQVLVAYFATYVFLQTFAIPGSIFLSILSGFLYPFPLALFLVCLCSGLGASFCYMLSYLVGRPVVYRYLTEKAVKWSKQVERHREHLINYIIFLRITPFLPNWFINITSPVINVPLKVFFIGTFLGVAPPSFVAIKAGTTLYQLTTAGEAVSWNSVFILMILAVLSILPAIFQNKLKQKFA